MENKLMISVPEFAERSGLGLSKAYELSRTQGFPRVRIGRRTLIPVEELRKWMARQAEQENRF